MSYRTEQLKRPLFAWICALTVCFGSPALAGDAESGAGFSAVLEVFTKYCVSCHSEDDADAELVLETHASIMRGGENGSVVVPGDSSASRLLRLMERKEEPFMPPGKRKRPEAHEIALVRDWIDAGAPDAVTEEEPTALSVPVVEPVGQPRRPIFSLTFSDDGQFMALGRRGAVDVRRVSSPRVDRRFDQLRGDVNAVDYSSDGRLFAAAGGEPGRYGEVRVWNTGDGSVVHVLRGHRDSVYAVEFSPDGRVLATGSYDQKIRLWNASTGALLHELSGHNGAVFDLDFRRDGKVLASASADRTTKLWDVSAGERLETLSANKEVYAVAFSPDGKTLATGGADSRIRVWEISPDAEEGTNPLRHLRFGHEGAIVQLTYSPDGATLLSTAEDRTVKLWTASSMIEHRLLEKRPDWPVAAEFSPDGAVFAVGCLDGSLELYGAKSGRRIRVVQSAPRVPAAFGRMALSPLVFAMLGQPEDKPEDPKPVLERAEPHGVQRGVWSRVRLVGKNLSSVTKVATESSAGVRLLDSGQDEADHVWIELQPAADRARGEMNLSVETAEGTSSLKLHVDDLIQIREQEPNDTFGSATVVVHPASLLGTIQTAGDRDTYRFHAEAGQSIVLDMAAKRIGSPSTAGLAVFGPDGALVASSNAFDPDRGANDPLLAIEVSESGEYIAQVHDHRIDGSAKHQYRLTLGALPYVTNRFPFAVPSNAESEVELIGYNLGARSTATVNAAEGGTVDVRVDPTHFRSRVDRFPLTISSWPEVLESEPNDRLEQANPLKAPCAVSGRIVSSEPGKRDVDFYRFESKKGQRWIIETEAERRGSPVDTRIEVFSEEGARLEKVLLQAMRDTTIQFRPVNSRAADIRLENPLEIRQNEYVYLRGEVCKTSELPRGPDAGHQFFEWGGKRRAFFDTTAVGHPFHQPAYIVEPHAPGARLVPNGLPVFTIYQTNDDDGDRRAGKDSKLDFVAPADGVYCVRVENVLPQGGARHCYRLIVREPRPDFEVSHSRLGRAIPRGSALNFTLTVDRKDAFGGAIRFDIEGVPEGYTIPSPIVVQSGIDTAKGVVHASSDAQAYGEEVWSKLTMTAHANVEGRAVEKKINTPAKIGLADKPSVTIELLPVEAHGRLVSGASHIAEMTIKPGETIRALLRVQRNGHKGEVGCDVQNLPHGIIVDNIGLSGVRVADGEDEREIFLTCESWVPETSRLCHAKGEGQCSLPVMLHVRR